MDNRSKKEEEADAEEVERSRRLDPRRRRLRRILTGDNSITNISLSGCAHEKITKKEYTSFHKSLTNVQENSLVVKHFSAKGQMKFKAILCAKKTPFDLFNTCKKMNDKQSNQMINFYSFTQILQDNNLLRKGYCYESSNYWTKRKGKGTSWSHFVSLRSSQNLLPIKEDT